MSTYCGERFVVEQLQSILGQLPPDGSILVRDDGSPDGTADVIANFADHRIVLTRGENLGFGASFLTLLARVPRDADMVMFADQDDLWLPGKIDRAWQHLQPLADRPALYGSAQMLTDAELRPLHATPPWPRGPSLLNALTENIITGCTAALNRPAVELLQRGGVPEGVRFHDWWMYLVVSAFGTVVFDDQPTLCTGSTARTRSGTVRAGSLAIPVSCVSCCATTGSVSCSGNLRHSCSVMTGNSTRRRGV
jgi:glycosyltransferase involved in cell wall biosynthesis